MEIVVKHDFPMQKRIVQKIVADSGRRKLANFTHDRDLENGKEEESILKQGRLKPVAPN